MSRLPAPVLSELAVTYDDGYEALEKGIYHTLGQIVREMENESGKESDKDGKQD